MLNTISKHFLWKRNSSIIVELHCAHCVVHHSDSLSHLTCVAVSHAVLLTIKDLCSIALEVFITTEAFERSLLQCSILTTFSFLGQHYDDVLHLILKESESFPHLTFFSFFHNHITNKIHFLQKFMLFLIESLFSYFPL